EVERGVLPQELADRLPLARLDQRRVVAEIGVRLEDGVAEPLAQLVEDELAHDGPFPLPPAAFASAALSAGTTSRGSLADRRSCTRPSTSWTGSKRGFTTPGRRSFRAILS